MKSHIWGSVESIRRDSLWSRNSNKVMEETGICIYFKNLTEGIITTYIELLQGRIKITQVPSLYLQYINSILETRENRSDL